MAQRDNPMFQGRERLLKDWAGFKAGLPFTFKQRGGGEEDRTPYLLNAIETLYQMSYTPGTL
jgi:hypothetical protein